MGQFDTILWDVDGTLLDFLASERVGLVKTLHAFGVEADEEMIQTYSAINSGYWRRLERGEVTKKELLTGRFETLLKQYGIEGIDIPALQKMYQLEIGSVFFFQDHAYELCRKLKGQYRQYIITNGVTVTQETKLRLSGLADLMDGVFISETIGYDKPNVKFFEACEREIPNFEKDRTMIVGDSLTSDMKGGNNAGIRTCWYNPKKLINDSDVTIDYEIRSLWEIEAILEK